MRISADECFMNVAFTLAMRSTCARRRVGCVLTDADNLIIGTGYNGGPKGAPHCIDDPCKGSGLSTGKGLDLCEAIHAEQNALMQCHDVKKIHTIYTTTFPCVHCFKMIANTGCKRLVYYDSYPSSMAIVEVLNEKLLAQIIIVPYVPQRKSLPYAVSTALSVLGDTDLASITSILSSGPERREADSL